MAALVAQTLVCDSERQTQTKVCVTPKRVATEGHPYNDCMGIIFHITKREAWDEALAAGVYSPEMFPVEGFIHCSSQDQFIRVANIRFRGQTGLVLLSIDTEKVTAPIVYENLEGGQELFPHIYGELNIDSVVEVVDFAPAADGHFSQPVDQTA